MISITFAFIAGITLLGALDAAYSRRVGLTLYLLGCTVVCTVAAVYLAVAPI